MDSYRLTCKGGSSPYARRARHSHEEDQAQGACRGLPLRGSRDKSQKNCHWSKEKEQCIGNLSRTGPTVGNDDEGEIERRGDYQTSEGVDERVDERVDCES